MQVAVAYEQDEPIGYIAYDKTSCGIWQIAVHPDHRRQGIGTSLLAFAANHTPSEKISVSNVDDRIESLTKFLTHYGFGISIILHELELKL